MNDAPSPHPAVPRTPVARAGGKTVLVGFLLLNTILRLAMIGVNRGEYTDGILQITQFERQDSFWPPLYTALVWGLRVVSVDTLWAGRLVSWAASVALVIPIWWVARRWAGSRAAGFALLLYTASPLALRWSTRVMTDMLFVCLFASACAVFLALWERTATHRRTGRLVVWLTLLSIAAALTRYQGLMLAPVVLVALVGQWRGRWNVEPPERATAWLATFAQILWFALPAWLLWQRFGHVAQIADRASSLGLGATLLNYWSLFEMFLYMSPYLLTLPVFAFFVIGLVGGAEQDASSGRPMPVRSLLLYAALAVLTAQSVFQSLQSRYLLPLLPLVLVCAGAGVARAEASLARYGRLGAAGFKTLLAATFIWSMGFALNSVALQSGAFGDIFDAGRHIRSMSDLPADTPIYTNEQYGPHEGMHGISLGFSSGRATRPIPETEYWLRGQPLPPKAARMEPGSILAVHSRNSFGFRSYMAFIEYLGKRYELTPVPGGTFDARLVPLLPDIMGEPGSEQNPIAWAALRYQPQHFQTRLFRVGESR